MGFKHVTVDRVLRDTERHIEKMNRAQERYDEETLKYRAMVTRTVDGISDVTVQTAELCEAIRKKLRGIKFGYCGVGAKSVWQGNVVSIQTLWAYYPDDEYALGMVGFADFAVSSVSDDKFCVYARNIKNEKFNDSRDQYYMAMSSDAMRAVKNAEKYLRRYTTSKLAEMSFDGFQSKTSMSKWTAMSSYRAAKEQLVNDVAFEAELQAIVKSGYQFNNPLLAEKVTAVIDKHAESVLEAARECHAWYVQVRNFAGHQTFDVLDVCNVRTARPPVDGGTKTYTPEELPEEIGHKLAALSMLEGEAFVEGLGMRVSPTSYWVLK